jgi:hypothetical protein
VSFLVSDDPEMLHRCFELHRERLAEQFAEQRVTLAALYERLAGARIRPEER